MTLQPAEPWSPAATQQPAEPWKPTTLHLRAVVGGLGLALLAVAGHRPDLVVLATPLLIIACWGAACRPHGRPRTEILGQGADLVEGERYLRSVWGAFDNRWLARHPIELTVAPAPGAFTSDAPVPHPSRMLGVHGARNAGEGAEFNDIRLFQPGDRPRLVHWPTSVRTGRLHVRTTYAQADTQVLLVVDAFADTPAPSRQDEGSLSRTVHAAASVAAWCLRTGDRMGLRVMGAVTTPVPAGHGRRHYLRVLGTLGRLRPGSDRTPASRRPRLATSPGSLVVVLSPLTETQVVELAAQQAACGLDVLVVDTAPQLSDPRGLSSVEYAARQVLALERDRTIAALEHRGIAVVPWRGPGTLDAALTAMSRPRSGT